MPGQHLRDRLAACRARLTAVCALRSSTAPGAEGPKRHAIDHQQSLTMVTRATLTECGRPHQDHTHDIVPVPSRRLVVFIAAQPHLMGVFQHKRFTSLINRGLLCPIKSSFLPAKRSVLLRRAAAAAAACWGQRAAASPQQADLRSCSQTSLLSTHCDDWRMAKLPAVEGCRGALAEPGQSTLPSFLHAVAIVSLVALALCMTR